MTRRAKIGLAIWAFLVAVFFFYAGTRDYTPRPEEPRKIGPEEQVFIDRKYPTSNLAALHLFTYLNSKVTVVKGASIMTRSFGIPGDDAPKHKDLPLRVLKSPYPTQTQIETALASDWFIDMAPDETADRGKCSGPTAHTVRWTIDEDSDFYTHGQFRNLLLACFDGAGRLSELDIDWTRSAPFDQAGALEIIGRSSSQWHVTW